MCPTCRIIAGIAGVLSVVAACSAYGQGPEPETLEAAIRVVYPPTLAEAERFSAELGVIAPRESARAIRERLSSCAVEPVCAPSALGDSLPEVVLGAVRFAAPAGLSPGLRGWLDRPGRAAAAVCAVQFKRNPSPEEVAQMLDLGVVPHFSAGNLVSVIEVPADAVEQLAALPLVHWMGLFIEEHKVSNRDRAAVMGRGANSVVSFYVWPLAKADADRGDVLGSLGANAVRHDPVANVYVVEASPDALLSTARLTWVRQVELAKHAGTHDGPELGYSPADSRELVSAPQAHLLYDGSGVRVGVLDTGIWSDHDDFGDAIMWQYDQETGQDTAPDTDGHGTRVAGVIGGRGVRLPAGRGVAPGASLYVAKGHEVDFGSNIWGYDLGDAFDQFLGQEVFLVNNSWGTRLDAPPDNPWNFGYDSAAALADAYADNEALTLIFSAGNEGDGEGTVTEPGVGKNVITVGAVSYTNDGDSGGIGRVPCYSSRGPTADDGRLKPDVVAPGGDAGQYTGDCVWSDHDYGVVTCNAQTNGAWLDSVDSRWGLNPPESFYTRQAGTSMAAPHVTGIAAMLYQAYGYEFPYDDGLVPRDIKALLVANAIPLHDYGTNPVNGYANTDTGYGLVDAYHTLFDIPSEKFMLLWGHGGVVETTANSQEWNFYLSSGVRRLVVVMSYEDDEGEENDGDALKDDLDLTLMAPDGTEFTFTLPAGVTTESPLEKIVVNTPSAYGTGEWTATVSGAEWNELLDPFEFQRYTIVAIAYQVDPYSPSISLEAPATIEVAPGETFSVSATITNVNGLTAAGITVELTGDAEFGGEIGVTQSLGNVIGSGSSKQVEFAGMVAPEEGGTYDLVLTASGINHGMGDAVHTVQVEVQGEAAGFHPQITRTVPVDGGPQVDPTTDLYVTFDQPMDITTINEITVSVVGDTSGDHTCVFTLDGSLKILTIYPQSDFAFEESIAVTLTTGICGEAGRPLPGPYTFSFVTRPAMLSAQNHSGMLADDETWHSGEVHIVTADVTVPEGLILAIQAGTVVKFQTGDVDLFVDGDIDVQGTAGSKVVFTSYRDDLYGGDTNGDGASNGARGDWGTIRFRTPRLNTLHETLIRYGGRSNTNMVDVYGSASLTIEDSVIEESSYRGVRVSDEYSNLTINGSTIANTSQQGVYVENAVTVNLAGNIFAGNNYGVYVTTVDVMEVNANTFSSNTWGVYQTSPTIWNLTDNTFTDNTYPVYQGNQDLAYSGNTFAGNGYQAIAVQGTLVGDVVWEKVQELAYLVLNDVTIPEGMVLTIDPGVVVKFQAVDTNSGSSSYYYRHDLFVNGTLDLRSTAAEKVVFTSSRDDAYGGDTNGDGDASSPGRENWGAIRYQGSAANVLHDAVIRYGGVGYSRYGSRYDTQMVWIKSGAPVTIQDCEIGQAYQKAVLIEAGSDVTLTGNTITHSTYPIYQGISDPVYGFNTITDNTFNAIVVGGTLTGDVLWEEVPTVPYMLAADVTIPVDVTLTIDPGVVVKFQAVDTNSGSSSYYYRHDLFVSGTLDLRSTAAEKVIFTSSRDDAYGGDTNGDGDASSPGRENWGAIRYQGSAANVLHDAVIRYGGVGYSRYGSRYDTQMVWVKSGASVTIQDCEIEQAYQTAVLLEAGSDATLMDNTITYSTYPIYQGVSDPVYGFNTITDNTFNAIVVGGTLTGDVLWEEVPTVPYLVAADVTIPVDVTLTIDPGVVVKFQAVDTNSGSSSYYYRHDLFVSGTLDLRSTAAERVVFTSSRDDAYGGDTNGDGDASSPGRENWGAIRYQGSAANVLHDAVIRYGGVGYSRYGSRYDTQMVWVKSGASVAIQDCEIGQAYRTAVLLEVGSDATLTGNTITHSTYPIYQGVSDPVYGPNTVTDNVYNAIVVGGTLTGDVLWENVPEVPYLVAADVTIPADMTLTLDPGVVVKFEAVDTGGYHDDRYRHDVIVQGTLNLLGTSGSPIVFTSSRDDIYGGDTNGDGDASSPGKGNWGAIQYQGGAPNVLHDAVIRYGGLGRTYQSGYYDMQMVWIKSGASVTIQDCEIDQAYRTAVLIEAGSDATLMDNTITHSTYPIYQGISDPVYGFNTITGNVYNAIVVGGVLTGDVVWEEVPTAVPYMLAADVTIPVDVTLTIDPGVVVKFEAVDTGGYHDDRYRHDVIVQGILNLQSTPSQRVVFTSIRDDAYGGDTNGDGDASLPGKGNWGAIRYYADSANVLHDAVIRYGGLGRTYQSSYYDTQMVWVKSGALVTIQDCEIDQAYRTAVLVEGNCDATLTNNTITRSTYPIYQGISDPVYDSNTLVNNSYDAIVVSGTLTHDVVWEDVPGVPYLVVADVTVPVNVMLTIGPGIVVKFQAVDTGGYHDDRYRHDLIVQGILSLQSTPSEQVVFTSSRDDSYGGDTSGDGDASSPGTGNWGAIRYTGSDNVLHDAVIRYGGLGRTYQSGYYDTQMMWVSNDAVVTMRDCIMEYAYDRVIYVNTGPDAQVMVRNNWIAPCSRGVYVAGTSDVVILFSTFVDCSDAAVRVEGDALVNVHKCNLLTSNNYGIYNAGTVQVDGRYNWWGDSSGPSGEWTGDGCAVSTLVDCDPWESELVTPGTQSPVITSTANPAAEFGLPYEYDEDGCASAAGTGPLVWSKRSGPDGLEIDSDTGCISWIPGAPGSYVVKIEVHDDISMDVQTFQVCVGPPGGDIDAPRVASFSYADLGGETGIWDAELTAVFTENVQVSWIDVAILDSGDNTMPLDSLGYHLPTHTLTVVASDLNEGEAYRLVLADTITDDVRNPLDGEFDGYTFPSGDGVAGGDFVVGFSKTVLRAGDFDGDGDVDLDDY
ncbi:MAG: S8 family serine peptidase, partial [Phycisphaerae bacterium]|nr:S8 family serine peptidase [Phycisphaerae bacterium]